MLPEGVTECRVCGKPTRGYGGGVCDDCDDPAPAVPSVQAVTLGGRAIGETIPVYDRGKRGIQGILFRRNGNVSGLGIHPTRADAEQAVKEAAVVRAFRANPDAPVWVSVMEREDG